MGGVAYPGISACGIAWVQTGCPWVLFDTAGNHEQEPACRPDVSVRLGLARSCKLVIAACVLQWDLILVMAKPLDVSPLCSMLQHLFSALTSYV